MHTESGALRALPDIAREADAAVAGALDWVGMDGIDVPVRLAGDAGRLPPPRRPGSLPAPWPCSAPETIFAFPP